MHEGKVSIPSSQDRLRDGRRGVLVVCAEADAEAIQAFIGPEIEMAWEEEDSNQPMISRRIVVTNSSMNGTWQDALLKRIRRNCNTYLTSGLGRFASRNYRFQVGDKILVVGPKDNVSRIAEMMGNSVKRLDHPNIATIFIGIIVGILFGSIPFAIP